MKRSDSNKGVALLMVLWVLMLLTVIVGEFCFTMRTRANITRNVKESTEAYYIAVAGVNRAVTELLKREFLPPVKVNVDDDTEEEPAPVWRDNMDMPPVPFDKGAYSVRIENESGKVNINMANQSMLYSMLSGLDMDDSEKAVIVDSILDWRDADHNHRINGAENDYYHSLPEPYDCRDGDFDSVSELLLVRGITPEIYRQVFENSVTVFPKNTNKTAKKTSKKSGFNYNQLNVNSIPADLWATLPGMTPDLVADIMAYRAEKDFTSLNEVQEIVGSNVFRRISRYLTLETTSYYRITSTGKFKGSKTSETVAAVVRIGTRSAEKFRVIQWIDELTDQEKFNRTPVS